MSEAKRLLEQATPLPWYWEPASKVLACRVGSEGHRRGVGDYAFQQIDEPWPGNPEPVTPEANAALIVYAVNHLPDYEAAVEALEHFVESWGGNYEVEGRLIDCEESYRLARAALARLREGEAAHVR